MAQLRIEKVTALPGTLTPDTLYLVKPVGSTEVQGYISSSDGLSAYPFKSGDSQPHPFMFLGQGDAENGV